MQIKYKGCDISHWQRNILFSNLKNEVDFCILKAGGSDKADFFYVDPKFEEYYQKCKAQNIPVGCYWFAGNYSKGAAAGIREAQYLLALIKNKKFEYPIYLDFEKGKAKNKDENTSFVKLFCHTLQFERFFTGIYSSDISGFRDTLDIKQLLKYSMWVARYGKAPQYVKNYAMWQYTSKGHLNSILGDVDLDYCFCDFPKIIKNKHLNGY